MINHLTERGKIKSKCLQKHTLKGKLICPVGSWTGWRIRGTIFQGRWEWDKVNMERGLKKIYRVVSKLPGPFYTEQREKTAPLSVTQELGSSKSRVVKPECYGSKDSKHRR